MVSEAGKRAQKKYDSQFDIIRFRVPKGQREVIQRYAEEHGESVNQMLNRLINEEMCGAWESRSGNKKKS